MCAHARARVCLTEFCSKFYHHQSIIGQVMGVIFHPKFQLIKKGEVHFSIFFSFFLIIIGSNFKGLGKRKGREQLDELVST